METAVMNSRWQLPKPMVEDACEYFESLNMRSYGWHYWVLKATEKNEEKPWPKAKSSRSQ